MARAEKGSRGGGERRAGDLGPGVVAAREHGSEGFPSGPEEGQIRVRLDQPRLAGQRCLVGEPQILAEQLARRAEATEMDLATKLDAVEHPRTPGDDSLAVPPDQIDGRDRGEEERGHEDGREAALAARAHAGQPECMVVEALVPALDP
jgi:hypothetical protein